MAEEKIGMYLNSEKDRQHSLPTKSYNAKIQKSQVCTLISEAKWLYRSLVHCLSRHPPAPKFYGVSSNLGILPYHSTDRGMTFTAIQPSQHKMHHHVKGDISPEGIYISPGNVDNDIKLYNMSSFPKIPEPRIMRENELIESCFHLRENISICCDYAGNIIEVSIESESTKYIYEGVDSLTSCMQSSKGYIIAGGEENIYIWLEGRMSGAQVVGKATGEGVWDIVEAESDYFLTAEYKYLGGYRVLLEGGIRSFIIYIFPTHPGEEVLFWSLARLERGERWFAVGGTYQGKGYLGIYQLNGESMRLVKAKEGILGLYSNTCSIRAITEIHYGVIIFAGSYCSEICLWEYYAWPSDRLQCWVADFVDVNHFVVP